MYVFVALDVLAIVKLPELVTETFPSTSGVAPVAVIVRFPVLLVWQFAAGTMATMAASVHLLLFVMLRSVPGLGASESEGVGMAGVGRLIDRWELDDARLSPEADSPFSGGVRVHCRLLLLQLPTPDLRGVRPAVPLIVAPPLSVRFPFVPRLPLLFAVTGLPPTRAADPS